MRGPDRSTRTIIGLGIAQTLAWGSTYYLPAVLAPAMARDLGMAPAMPFAGLSLALGLAAFLGPAAGRWIDRRGGRGLLAALSPVFACGLALLATADSALGYFAGWAVLGLAMGCGLYEAAFATLVRLHGQDARGPITGITLIAGFASTVAWPFTAWLEHAVGWRGACAVWAGLHLLVCLPIHLRLPRPGPPLPLPAADTGDSGPDGRAWAAMLLAIAFAVTWFTSTAMAAHLPLLLQIAGLGAATAVAAAALVGPAQVAARIVEFSWLRRVHPLLSARLASAAHPLGGLILLAFGAPAGFAFTILHGAGNGILTIAKGTLPLVIFGAHGYGARQGWLMVPARISQAAAPFAFGLAMEHWGLGALWLSIGLGVLGLLALAALRPRAASLDR
jgi:predicted MFS family arabinose efflux permease